MTHSQRLQQFPTYALARWYVNACGFSVLPLKPGSKQRLLSGTHFQEWLPCDHHLQRWFCTAPSNGIAVVAGAISGNLVILDFDEFGVYQVWHALMPVAHDLPCVRTARGVHVYVRCQTLPPSGEGEFQGMRFGQILASGAITAPPSLHPTGHQYAWAAGNPRLIPLFPCLASLGVARCSNHGGQVADRRPLPAKSYREDAPQRIRNPRLYVQAAICGEQRAILAAVEGARNRQLYQSALKLAKYLELMSLTELETDLERVALQAGLEPGEIKPTIRSGLEHGVKNGVLRI